MKKALVGYGGFAREIKHHMQCELSFFVDDEYYDGAVGTFPLSEFNPFEYQLLIAIGDPLTRKRIVDKLPPETEFFSYVHPSAIILDKESVEIGEGSFICSSCILTTNIKIGKHSHLNLSTTVGHDTVTGDFFTTAPGAKISGNCLIGDYVYVGTNSSIKEKISICDNVKIGLNAGVVKNINEPGVYVGTPAKFKKL